MNKKFTILGSRIRKPGKKLEAFPNTHPGREYRVILETSEFTALCPITGQPDFGTITVSYVPDKLIVESKSLKLYLWSFRQEGHFHEEVVNRILDDLVRAVQPRRMEVKGEFRARGGITITVVAEYP
ncbi:MAG: preQ(1) synthase [Candidatus Edwardsbacteria bacterium]|nr:preQ(1) synthase [Candidatus Edwardsbacteria bacterium]